MQTLTTLHTLNIAMAGDDFAWCSGSKGRPQGGQAALLAWLMAQQGDVCAACGEGNEVGDVWQVCHIVSGGPNRRGYIAGNVYAGHQTCNDADRDVYGAIVPLTSLVRADVVPVTYPTASDLRDYAPTDRADRYARRLARRSGE